MRVGSGISRGKPPAPDRAEAVEELPLANSVAGSDVTDTILCTFSNLLITAGLTEIRMYLYTY
jgi:hypothetical protein